MTEGYTEAPTTPQAPLTGQPEEVHFFENYWGVSETLRFWLPDHEQWFDIRPMDEGRKSAFQKQTNRGIRMNQRTNDAHIDVDPAEERHTLIRQSVVDLFIKQPDPKSPQGWSQLPTGNEHAVKRSVEQVLQNFNPKIIQDLEFFIRTSNPWMQADMDLNELLEEEKRIQTLIRQKREEDAGEESSASN